jgi:hypothetical protein
MTKIREKMEGKGRKSGRTEQRNGRTNKEASNGREEKGKERKWS